MLELSAVVLLLEETQNFKVLKLGGFQSSCVLQWSEDENIFS